MATELATGVIPPVLATGGPRADRHLHRGTFSRARALPPSVRRSWPGLSSFAIGMAVALRLCSRLPPGSSGVTFADSLIAFAPGGLEAMTMLALILGLDPLYVGIHHLVRFIGIALLHSVRGDVAAAGDPPAERCRTSPQAVSRSRSTASMRGFAVAQSRFVTAATRASTSGSRPADESQFEGTATWAGSTWLRDAGDGR